MPVVKGPIDLTRRELEIATLVCGGHSNKFIGREVNLSEGTIKAHIHNILRKLRLQNRSALILAFGSETRTDADSSM